MRMLRRCYSWPLLARIVSQLKRSRRTGAPIAVPIQPVQLSSFMETQRSTSLRCACVDVGNTPGPLMAHRAPHLLIETKQTKQRQSRPALVIVDNAVESVRRNAMVACSSECLMWTLKCIMSNRFFTLKLVCHTLSFKISLAQAVTPPL